MVYFFHHYELPAILQQARVQQLLTRNGNTNITVTAGQVRNTANQTTGNGTEQGTNGGNLAEPQQVNMANGHIATEVSDEDDGHHILQDNMDQGLLNEIFEGVEDVRIGGFNIDQQLLHHIEEEIQELQFSHNQTVSNTENLTEPSIREETSTDLNSSANSSQQSDLNPAGIESSSTSMLNQSVNINSVSADTASLDCDTASSADGACMQINSVTQSKTCDTDCRRLHADSENSEKERSESSVASQSAIGNDNKAVDSGANLRFRSNKRNVSDSPKTPDDQGTEV